MQKSVFASAAALTAVVLVVGIGIGIMLEGGRIDEIKKFITDTDILFDDARLQALYYQNAPVPSLEFCESALQANLDFNERIYQKGLEIDRYELASRFSDLRTERRQYALLQFQFWLNAERLRTLCGLDYYTVLYLWKHKIEDQQTNLDQKVQSAVLLDLKEKCGRKIMLSPIPVDLNLTSVDTIVRKHSIAKMPAIVINDNITLQGLTGLDDLERYFKC